jgi:hypothetical protein
MSIGIQSRVAKKNEDDPLEQHSARLHRSQVAFIKKLHAHRVFPGNESDVLRHLLQRAIDDLIDRDFVSKRLRTADGLGEEKR